MDQAILETQGYEHVYVLTYKLKDWNGLTFNQNPFSLLKASKGQYSYHYAIGTTMKFKAGIPSYDDSGDTSIKLYGLFDPSLLPAPRLPPSTNDWILVYR